MRDRLLVFATIFIFLTFTSARQHRNSTLVSGIDELPFKKWKTLSVFDGKETSINKHPYLVVVKVGVSKFCVGAIVSSSWVLTIADCVQNTSKKIRILMYRRYDKVRDVKNVTFYPTYPSDVYDYDYACLQIKGKFHFSKKVQSVMIAKKPPASGSTMVVSGWNTDYLLSSASVMESNKVIVEGNMTWLSLKSCNTTLSRMGVTWTKRMACAYHQNKTTLCAGGWGAPFVKDGVLYGHFVGADAEGFCTSRSAPVVLSNLAPVASWVRSVTGARLG